MFPQKPSPTRCVGFTVESVSFQETRWQLEQIEPNPIAVNADEVRLKAH